MKKLFLLGALFAAGLSFTACSSGNEEVAQESSLDNKFDAQGNAYLNIAINLPTTRGGATRANEVYDHGLATEYAVKDAVLILFNGTSTSEGTATFVGAYNLNKYVSGGGQTDRITERILCTKQINKGSANLTGSTGLLAFVALNVDGKFVVNDETHALTINSASFTGNFNALKDIVMTSIGDVSSKGLFMSNAPMNTVAGGSADPSSGTIKYLTQINVADVYNSESDAYAGSNYVDIYVERAAVKINVTTEKTGSTALEAGTTTYNADGIKWIVENYNTSYYALRRMGTPYLGYKSANVDGSLATRYRFVDGTATAPGLFRTYWAEDANMAAAPSNTSTVKLTQPDVSSWKAIGGIDYVAENTVNAQSLKQEYTTRVVLAVPFNGGADFYTSSLDDADKIYSEENMKAKIKEFAATLSSYATWHTGGNASATLSDVGFTKNADGSASVASITTSNSSDASAIVTEINSKADFSFFKDGMAYYKVLIKHFGDVETPLAATIGGTGYNDIYGSSTDDQNTNFLGRYSVVRNNWYNIVLDGIRHIGKPSVPDVPTDTPDDEIDAYLKVRINILSWAKRVQNVTL